MKKKGICEKRGQETEILALSRAQEKPAKNKTATKENNLEVWFHPSEKEGSKCAPSTPREHWDVLCVHPSIPPPPSIHPVRPLRRAFFLSFLFFFSFGLPQGGRPVAVVMSWLSAHETVAQSGLLDLGSMIPSPEVGSRKWLRRLGGAWPRSRKRQEGLLEANSCRTIVGCFLNLPSIQESLCQRVADGEDHLSS